MADSLHEVMQYNALKILIFYLHVMMKMILLFQMLGLFDFD